MSFELTDSDRTRLCFARADRFDDLFPDLNHCCIVHQSSLDDGLTIVGDDEDVAYLLANIADVRYWVWVAMGAEQLHIYEGDFKAWSGSTFPFFESRPKIGLKLRSKRSRIRITQHGNSNPGTTND